MCYSELIDEDHDKKRDAPMKHFSNDWAKSTEFMDADTELELLDMYKDWLFSNWNDATERDIQRSKVGFMHRGKKCG